MPYALIWSNGTVNLWLKGRETQICPGTFNPIYRTYRYSCVYRGTYAGADTTRGILVTSWSDSAAVTGGDFWMVNVGDTLVGLATTRVSAFCGDVALSTALRLVPQVH
jgi:hypothetical protein